MVAHEVAVCRVLALENIRRIRGRHSHECYILVVLSGLEELIALAFSISST